MHSTLFEVLAALREGSTDASGLLRRLARLGGEARAPSLPALYRQIRIGIDEGWIRADELEPDGPGRPRKEYGLTPEGARAIRDEARRLTRFTRLARSDGPLGEET